MVFGVQVEEDVPTAAPEPTASPAPTTDGGVIVIIPTGPLNMTGARKEYNAQDSYNVIGYLCDDNLNPLSEAQQTVIRRQGDAPVRVCVGKIF